MLRTLRGGRWEEIIPESVGGLGLLGGHFELFLCGLGRKRFL